MPMGVEDQLAGLMALASVGDKYDCQEALGNAIHIWIESITKFLQEEKNGDWLFGLLETAYILDNPRVFQMVSKEIIMSDNGGLEKRIYEWSTKNILPLKIYCKNFNFTFPL
jgi:hypothetical protein